MADSQPSDRVGRKRGPKPGTHKTDFPFHGVREAMEQGRVQSRKGICAKCGQQHLICSGHVRIRDEAGKVVEMRPCRSWPMHGQSVCWKHGGSGRNRKVGQRQWVKEREESKEMERLERAVKTFGLPITGVTPQQALLDEIARTAGHVRWLGDQVGNLDPETATWGTYSEEQKKGTDIGGGEDGTSVIDLLTTTKLARPAVVIQMYQAERAHLVQVCKVAIQCGIAERQVRLAEEQGRLIAQVMKQAFEDPELQLTVTQLQVARTVASRALRSLSSMEAARAPLSVVRSLPEHGDGGSDG